MGIDRLFPSLHTSSVRPLLSGKLFSLSIDLSKIPLGIPHPGHLHLNSITKNDIDYIHFFRAVY